MQNTLKITTPTDREIVITREFKAPRRLVWEALTKPELIRRWLFLPPGWSMTECTEDIRVGGKFRWAWSGPDGKEAMAMHGTYREVTPPKPDGSGGRLARTETFEFGCVPQAGEQNSTLLLTERDGGGRTVVTITVVYPSKQARDGALASGMERGMSVGYDNMERLLASGEGG